VLQSFKNLGSFNPETFKMRLLIIEPLLKKKMVQERTVLPSLKNLIEAAKSPSNSTVPSNSNYLESPIWKTLFDPTRENFEYLYGSFLKKHHQTHHTCKISDHVVKFKDPPTYQKKTFSTYDLYNIVLDCGGIHRVIKILN
jgi:hypothetical protein